MKVALVFRKKNPAFHSIERVFSPVIEELQRSVAIQRIVAPGLGVSWSNLAAVRSEFKKGNAGLCHVTGDIHYVVIGLPRKKVLLTIHDCVFLYQTKGFKRWILKKLLLDWPVGRAALITTISEATRQDILKYTGCSPDKVVVIPNPVDGRIRFKPREFNEGRPVILFVGTTPYKNLVRVIPALESIPCLLHIIGKVPDATIQLLVQHRITYKQEKDLSDEEIAAAYAEADIVLFPSTFEGFGMPIVEAQKTGRPVITSNISPMREIAGAGACLVDPYSVEAIREGVLKVIGNKEYREGLVREGLENIGRFDVKTIARSYMNCYKQITDNE